MYETLLKKNYENLSQQILSNKINTPILYIIIYKYVKQLFQFDRLTYLSKKKKRKKIVHILPKNEQNYNVIKKKTSQIRCQ